MLLVIALLCLLPSSTTAQEPACDVLQVGVQRSKETVLFDSGERRYCLEGLIPGGAYEARVSFPATLPATVFLTLEKGTSTTGRTHISSSRRLLDIEKVIFSAERILPLQGDHTPLVLTLRASRRSFHRDGPNAGSKELKYNIVVDPLWLGVPRSVFPVIIVGVLLLLAVVLFVPYWDSVLAPALMTWLIGPITPDPQKAA